MRGGFGIFVLKNPSKLRKISQRGGGGVRGSNLSLNTPLASGQGS